MSEVSMRLYWWHIGIAIGSAFGAVVSQTFAL
ncbi:hypothetical protein NIES4073_39420 [Kalymmatonema gypsitolerans NIES-4073]|nr:hypothetical protein NIES4073_39420 [Scytonema sp. NIES-4073]